MVPAPADAAAERTADAVFNEEAAARAVAEMDSFSKGQIQAQLDKLDNLKFSKSNKNLIDNVMHSCELRVWKDIHGNDIKKKLIATLKKAVEVFKSYPHDTIEIEEYLRKLVNGDGYGKAEVAYLGLDKGEATAKYKVR